MVYLCLLFILNCWLQTKAQGFGINLMQIPKDDKAEIACTTALLEKYFHSGEDLSGSVIQMTITNAPTHLQTSLLQAIHNDPNYPWTIVVKSSKSQDNNEADTKHVLHEKPQCYLLVIENVENEDMDEIIVESSTTSLNWNPLAQFVVYFASVEETEEEMTNTMIEILLHFMNKKIYNVNIIGRSEEKSVYLGKTVFPYHPDNNCGKRVITVETLDICYYQESNRETDEAEKENVKNIIRATQDEMALRVREKEHAIYLLNMGNESEKIKTKIVAYNQQEKHKYNQINDFSTASFKVSQNLTTFKNINFRNSENSKNVTFKYQSVETLTSNNATQTVYPQLYIEELYRSLFLDKFPKDLSGCPLVAAFRPQEPYIFKALNIQTFEEHEENNEIPLNKSDGVQGQGSEDYYAIYNKQQDTEEDISYEEEDQDSKDYYVIYNKQLDNEESVSEIHLNGIEYKMIQTIAERLNINIEMQEENNNLYQLLQQLIDGEIEIIVGGIDEDPTLSQFVSSTIPYHQDDLTWCVAKAQNTRNFFNFLAIFQISAWLMTLLFIFTASWIIFITKRCLKIHLRFFKSCLPSSIYVMGIILGQAIGLRPIPTSLKLCFGTLFFMGFMFGNIYQSFLISTLTTPKSLYQISHLNEIYQNRMHVRGSVENVRHLNKEGEIYRYVREQFQMCYNIEECLQLAVKDSKLAVVVSRQHFLYNPRIPHNNLYCFDRNENIYVYLVTMLMPKKFHLLHKINPVIQHIIESGHMQKWARDLDGRHKTHKLLQHDRKGQFKSLTLAQVAGSFVFISVLLTVVLWIFFLECATYWLVVKRRTRLKLAKYMHMKFF